MNPLSMFFFIFIVAFLVEAMVEYLFGTPFDKIEALKPYKWMLMYLAFIIAAALSVFYKIDLFYLIAEYAEIDWPTLTRLSWPGYLFSGFVIGRGSNFVHQLIALMIEKVLYYRGANQALDDYNEPEGQN